MCMSVITYVTDNVNFSHLIDSACVVSIHNPTVYTAFTILMSLCWATRFVSYDFYFHGEMMPWLALTYATLFATLYAYNAYSWAGKRVSPAITTVYNTLQPVGTSLLSFIIMGTVVNIAEVLGGVLVMVGLVVTVWGRHTELRTHVSPRGMLSASYTSASVLPADMEDGGGEEVGWVMVDDEDTAGCVMGTVNMTTCSELHTLCGNMILYTKLCVGAQCHRLCVYVIVM